MSIRIRADGLLLCAAKHPAMPDDAGYIDDGVQYVLAVEQRVLIPEEDEAESGRWHWRAPGEPFRWLPGDSVLDPVIQFGSARG